MHVSIASEKLFSLFGITITNTVFTAVIVVTLISIFTFFVNSKLSYLNPSKLQLTLEMIVDYLGGMVKELMGNRRANKILGLLFTFFIFILISNWFGLIPIVPTLVHKVEEPSEGHAIEETVEKPTFGSCFKNRNCFLTTHGVEVFKESAHVLRAPTTDLSMTISLALIAFVTSNFAGFKVLKLGYLKKFFNFSNALDGIVGLLELLSEFIRIISFSFRLFGNIFAGELLLIIMTSLTYGIGTIPFLFLETFVGLIQAFVFFILLAIFVSLAIQDHNEH